MEINKDEAEVPVEITNKLSETPLENATWHSDFEKGYTTPPTITPVEKTTDAALKTSKVEDDTSGRKSYLKTLYTIHLYTNIKYEICNKLKNMLKIYITISFSHTKYIYIDISIHVIDIYLMSEKKPKENL